MRGFLLIAMISCSLAGQAQHATFISSGKIVFERKINTFAVMDILLKETKTMPADQAYAYLQKYRSSSPQFWVEAFELYFDQTNTLYQPENPAATYPEVFPVPLAYNNKVLNNLQSKETAIQKQAFEKSFLIKDSLRHISWKLTDETREIAGYQCHRANALLFDSIYVVAYYADEILAKGGPESFAGLPGMILGLALPHQHITIFAKSVSMQTITPEKWKLQEGRSDKVNNKEYVAAMMKMLSQYGLVSPWIHTMMTM